MSKLPRYSIERWDGILGEWLPTASSESISVARQLVDGRAGEWRIMELRRVMVWTNEVHGKEKP